MQKNKKKRSITLILRNYFITGVVVLIPIGFTLYLTKFIIGISSKIIPQNINPNNYLPYAIPGIEILISVIFASSAFSKTIIRFDSWMWGESDFKAPVQKVVDEYMRLNPNVEIRMEASGWAETRNKLMTRAAAGDSVDVMMLDSELNQEVMWKSMYSISDIRRHGEDILVASWFYLYRISPSEGEVWRCEHTGLVERIVANSDGSRIVISGDNQNDYTRENRIFWINPDSTPYALSSESEIDDDLLAFTEGSELKPPVAGADEDIYANDGDIAGLLTAEEQEMLSKAPTKFDDSELFDMLDDEIEKMANFEDEDEADILADLSDDGFVTHIPPTADAGSDQVMGASDDGTAIVILDGTATTAGSQNIEQWSWRDGDSKQIGKTPKIKVRLPIGNYTFTLTVTDSGRESSTDTITVQIQGDVTDDSFSLLED